MTIRLGRAVTFSLLLAVLFCMGVGRATAESVEQLRARLVGTTIYLRGFWMDRTLEFDGSGKPLGQPKPGPVTLSGIRVSGAKLQGKDLVLRGERIALVAGPDGGLKPETVHSTTLMWPTGKKFIANEEVKITLRPDESGDFDSTLKAVFADSLKELSSSVPPYWGCYAKGYFEQEVDREAADKTVEECIKDRYSGLIDWDEAKNGAGSAPPRLLNDVPVQYNEFAAEMSVTGVSVVECIVTKNGIPVGFEVVRPLGAGLDESALQSMSRYHFKPAERNGQPVAVSLKLEAGFRR